MFKNNFIILFFIVVTIGCKEKEETNIVDANSAVEKNITSRSILIHSSGEGQDCYILKFKKIRDLIYKRQKDSLKDNFSFPLSGNDDVWNLIFIDDDSFQKNEKQSFTVKILTNILIIFFH
jgi:thioredoxin-related protein